MRDAFNAIEGEITLLEEVAIALTVDGPVGTKAVMPDGVYSRRVMVYF